MNSSRRSRSGGLRILLVLFLMVAVTHLGGEQVRAQEIRANFGCHYSSFGNWNLFKSPHPQNRENLTEFTTGQGSGIDFMSSGWPTLFLGYYCWPYTSMDWVTPADMGQGGWGSFTPSVSTATFTNLTGPLWRVEILSAMDPRVVQAFIQDITVNGLFADADYRGVGVNGDDFDSVVDGQMEANWLIWTGVRPDNGTLTIQFDSTQYGEGHIMNAVRLVWVPEPATLGLLAVGLGAVWMRKKRVTR